MKTLIVTNSLSGGGAESSMRLINIHLQKSGANSTLLALNKTEGSCTGAAEIELGRKWKSGPIQTISNFIDFYRILKMQNPDTIVVNCELPELYVAFAPIKIKRLICVEHTSQPWAGRKMLGILVRTLLSIRKSTWVTVNKSQVTIWPIRTKAIHIPNPVAVPQLNENTAATQEFVFVGRLREEKGVELILQAASEVKTSVDIYGSGELEDYLKAKYPNVGKFHGFVDDPWKSISPEQVLIVASEYEGDGKVVVEGLMADLPILLRDNSDLRRFELPDQNYFTDDNDLKSKMADCLKNKDKFRPGNTKFKGLVAERDPESISDRWQTLLD